MQGCCGAGRNISSMVAPVEEVPCRSPVAAGDLPMLVSGVVEIEAIERPALLALAQVLDASRVAVLARVDRARPGGARIHPRKPLR